MKLSIREEQIMNILWSKKKLFIKEIIEALNENPKPPYNTISSITRRLVDKGVVGYEAFGNTHRYFPILKKEKYKQHKSKDLLENYFENSFKEMVSYFVDKKVGDVTELEELLKEIKKKEK